jgi:hypothetical protein
MLYMYRACCRCRAIYNGDLPAEKSSYFLCHATLEVPEGTPEDIIRGIEDHLTTARQLAAMAAYLWAAAKEAADREEVLDKVTVSVGGLDEETLGVDTPTKTRAGKRKIGDVGGADGAGAKRLGTIASAC